MAHSRPVMVLAALLAVAPFGAAAAGNAHDPLDAGDRAWSRGDRKDARERWLLAAGSDDPAVQAMAELRLLLLSGNLGLALHGPRADRALASCPAADPWCALAEADYELFLAALGLPSDLDRARDRAALVQARLPGPAAARLVWAGALPLGRLEAEQRDGLGDLLLEHQGRWPAGPGTWLLGLGVAGAPGLGVGGTVRFLHPDLRFRGWRLDLQGTLTSRGVAGLAGRLTTTGPTWSTWGLSLAHRVVDVYPSEGGDTPAATVAVSTLAATAAPGHTWGRWSAWLGPAPRIDQVAGERALAGHGLFGGTGWDGRRDGHGPSAVVAGELAVRAALARYDRLDLTLDGRWIAPGPAGDLAFRLVGETLAWGDPPTWRLPAAGGGEILRHPPLGRFRDRHLAGAVAEWRLARDRTLGGVVFVEAAWVGGPHGGAGAGLRLRLPPRPHNTVRVDVAGGDGGWGVTAGWGEAF